MAGRDLPPLSALRAFEAAARHLSFRVAAEELGLTQSAISHQVAALEQHFGARLFDRSGRRIALSEPGRLLFPLVRDGFDRLTQGADLLLLRANPLESVVHANERAGVALRGRWFPEEELRAELERRAARFEGR